MKISDILSEDMVVADFSAENKRMLLEKLATLMAEKENLDKSAVFEALWERENLGSTGYESGVAFPHARINGLSKVVAMFVRLEQPIDFDALDGQTTDLIACMISPENSGEDHLSVLAELSRVLRNDTVCSQIRKAKGSHDIYLALQS